MAIILNPLWLLPLWNHGPPFWFLYSWLPSAREDPEGLCGPGRVVPANVAEGESQRITLHEDGVSLGCWATCVSIFLFQELTENGASWYSDWRAPNVTIFLVSVGAFFCSILLEIVFWCWDERISFSHEQRWWQGQIYWKTYTYVCICISIYFCTVLLITHQRLLYFNTGALLEAQIFFQAFVFTFLITGLEKMLLRGRN